MPIDPDTLFLRRVSQVAMLTESEDEIDLADLAGHLRQLLFDRHSLIEHVSEGMKLTFEVGIFRPGWGPHETPFWDKVVCQMLGDGIDPHTSSYGVNEGLSLNQFGQHVIGYSLGQSFTIKDVIKYNSNRRGGVHFDPFTKDEFKKFEILESLYIGGIAAPARDLKAIGRVVLRSLAPLITQVKSRIS